MSGLLSPERLKQIRAWATEDGYASPGAVLEVNELLYHIDILTERVKALREVHKRNAEEDYRGYRSVASARSFEALIADDVTAGVEK